MEDRIEISAPQLRTLASAYKPGNTNASSLERELSVGPKIFRRNYCRQKSRPANRKAIKSVLGEDVINKHWS